MKAKPLNLKQANAVVARWHRHSKPTQGGYFAVGVERRGELVGVAIVGRPIARLLDDGYTVEILRVCTDGTLYACSNLYGRCLRIAREMGYRRVVTYTLQSEPGTSLRAAGFRAEDRHAVTADIWDRPSRNRAQTVETLFGVEQKRDAGPKWRWTREI